VLVVFWWHFFFSNYRHPFWWLA